MGQPLGGFGSWGLQAAQPLPTNQAPPLAGTSPVLTHLPPRPGAPASSYPAAAFLLAAPTFSPVFLGPLRNEGDVPPFPGGGCMAIRCHISGCLHFRPKAHHPHVFSHHPEGDLSRGEHITDRNEVPP